MFSSGIDVHVVDGTFTRYVVGERERGLFQSAEDDRLVSSAAQQLKAILMGCEFDGCD